MNGESDAVFGVVMSWPDVSVRRMFGADCFLARGHMFGFRWRGRLALWIPDSEYERALHMQGVEVVAIRPGIPMGTWLQLPLSFGSALIPRLRASYEHYLERPPKRKRHVRRRPQ